MIPAPAHAPAAPARPAPIAVWLGRPWDVNAPAGVEPLAWRRGSSRPVTTAAEAQARLDWDRWPWVVEDDQPCLPTGGAVEPGQLDDGAESARLRRAAGGAPPPPPSTRPPGA